MQRILITIGVVLIVLGLFWPLLQKLGLGRLPGDLAIEKENFKFYFPITTSIIVSIVLTLLIWLFSRK
jgi:ribose/xylose/arabinose/galactoside ABC-type transport system permease subunit